MAKVFFYNVDIDFLLKEKKRLKSFIEALFVKEKKTLQSLNYVFCSDEYLLNINKTYLNHNFCTDIITFDLSESQNQKNGEVYISIERVKENAIANKTPFYLELLRVIFHGPLHLCGHKDKTKKELKQMRQKEDLYINLYLKTA